MPTPIRGIALVDTGASATFIDEQVAQELGLPVLGTVTMASASHAATEQRVYPVTIEVTGLAYAIDAPQAIGAELGHMGIIALIGRDVLQSCTLFYNGPAGEITLSL